MQSSQLKILRRARGAMDGSSSIYFVVNGARVPLSPQDAQFVADECRWMAKRTDQEMVAFMDTFQRVEQGKAPFAHILMGLLLEEPVGGNQEQEPVEDAGVPDRCDRCAVELATGGWAVDGITAERLLWSWMCVRCFLQHGCGLGIGWGQLYRRSASGAWALMQRKRAVHEGKPTGMDLDRAVRELEALFSDPESGRKSDPT